MNVSSVDMQNGNLGQLLAAFKKEGASLKYLALEATEAVYMAMEIGSSIASCSIADVITGSPGEPRRPVATNTKSSTGVWHRDPIRWLLAASCATGVNMAAVPCSPRVRSSLRSPEYGRHGRNG